MTFYPPESARADRTVVGVVTGEGVGPEVIDVALDVLSAACQTTGVEVEVETAPELTTRDEHGLVIDKQARETYTRWFTNGTPVLHGPAGGRFVYSLRRDFALPVKITPVIPNASTMDAALMQPERLAGVDLVIVRDNSGGLYQGEFGRSADGSSAYHVARYERTQVELVMSEAVQLAAARSGRLTVVTKPGGVPSISALWREVAEESVAVVAGAGTSLDLQFLEIDNACFQMIANPMQFDVVVTPNMFGDVLGDTSSVLLGSRGMAYSANFGPTGNAVYQTAHGAAHDLAGRDVANPVAQILSLAWLVRESLGRPKVAEVMESAVNSVLADGIRTTDIASGASIVVGTKELGRRIVERAHEGER